MSFFTILETLLIGPLKLVFEIIFDIANRLTGHPGLAIIVLSLTMNILVLPLYRRADAMQEEARDIDAKLRDGVTHIKKTFSGDERMMILQAYYRQNHYSPISSLNGSVSLLLEIPFFLAAYQFLSHAIGLDGVSFGPIVDLGAPDGLLVIGGMTFNLLPILMTLINVCSSAIYLKGFPLKSKIQLYAMALFFLVFLYTSPSCLVFYWTLNNVFSFVKNVFYKLKNPRRVLCVLVSVVGIFLILFGLLIYDSVSVKRKLFFIVVGAVLLSFAVYAAVKDKMHVSVKERIYVPDRKLFILGSVFLTVLIGILIPSTYLAASPQEFVDINYFHHPFWYVVNSTILAAGTFLIWMRVFYWLADEKGKVIFDKLVWVLCAVMLVNYMFFGTDLGVISPTLQYENEMSFTMQAQLVNLTVVCVVGVLMYLFAVKWKRATTTVLLTAMIALGGMSAVNLVTIDRSMDAMYIPDPERLNEKASFPLSKNGKNVVVLMLDRAIGEYVPYIFNEKPELVEKFDGFTYYSNTISFGMSTNFGSPPLLGGYEYTPVEMNKRDSESLVSKHNEALKVMPVLFDENGYEVTVCDPVYANYQWIPDLSIYDEYPDINTYITDGNTVNVAEEIQIIESNRRNFFCFALMKTMPLCVQPTIYDHGRYNQVVNTYDELISTSQVAESISKATGTSTAFVEPYDILGDLSDMTQLTDEATDTFMFMCNDTTHEAMLLQEPAYVPAQIVDNTEYDAANTDRFTIDGKTLKVESVSQMSHYHVNMAAFLQIAEWLDYLRINEVYDNTRIIIVSDHGRNLGHNEELKFADGAGGTVDAELYYPLLMVKDFDSEGFVTSDEFMTNADVPTLATQSLIEEARNPFTGKLINSDEKTNHEQFIIMSTDWEVDRNNGNTYFASEWASVKDNLWNSENWSFYNDEIVLSEHSMPQQ